jgi:hypothetical protein
MRVLTFCAAAGLFLAPLLGPGARGSELGGIDPRTGKAPPAAKAAPPAKEAVPEKKDGDSCHGTAIEFVDTPQEAAKIAKKEQKLVFVLHVSGHFEDPRFT